ncbi:hypothetical protein HBB16_15960 [Pseudonocardia sp. MCCB 268]|nr:hypothetical protein [Pseudonocardia cytotoxica]
MRSAEAQMADREPDSHMRCSVFARIADADELQPRSTPPRFFAPAASRHASWPGGGPRCGRPTGLPGSWTFTRSRCGTRSAARRLRRRTCRLARRGPPPRDPRYRYWLTWTPVPATGRRPAPAGGGRPGFVRLRILISATRRGGAALTAVPRHRPRRTRTPRPSRLRRTVRPHWRAATSEYAE